MKLFITVALLFFFSFIQSHGQVADSLQAIFKYDTKAPFHFVKSVSFIYTHPKLSLDVLKDSSATITAMHHVRVSQVRFTSIDTLTTYAWITEPALLNKQKKYPLLILQHWGEGNKDHFLSEAIAYSEQGFICLLPDAVWLSPASPYQSFRRQGYEMVQKGVIQVLRGIDLLKKEYPINENQIFFTGHSFGAWVGSILSGIDTQIQAYVLMTGLYSTTKSYVHNVREDIKAWRDTDREGFDKWLQRMKSLDADLYIFKKTKPVFHQFATEDEYITQAEFKLFDHITPPPKKISYYPTSHALNQQAFKDRMQYIGSFIR